MAFDPVCRWLMSAVLPPEPPRRWFLHRCADDVASPPPPSVSPSRLRRMPHCCWNVPEPQKVQLDPVRKHVSSAALSSGRYPCSSLLANADFGLAQLVTDGLKREPSFLVYVLASGAHRNALSKDWFLSRSMPCLFSPSVLLWLRPDAATITAVNLALQRLSAGPFHSIPSALLRRGSACGLKIDVDGIQLASKAAHSCCFRMRCFVSRHGAHKSCKRLRWQNP